MVGLIEYSSQGVSDFFVDGVHIGQRNGLDIITGTGHVIAGVDDPGDNRVAITVNTTVQSGTATVTANVTSTDVTHGLGSTPARVLLSPKADTEGVRWWVSTTTATTFTIEMNATTTANVTFDWRAQGEEE